MKNFILPGLYEHYLLNFSFLSTLRDHPEFFIDDVNVSAVYGNFQLCIFDGGRNFSNYRQTTQEEIKKITDIYNNDFHVPIRLVLTNPQLEPKHFKNRFGNVILRTCENDMNEIVINNPEFEEYVRTNYPKYTFISSTTKCLNTPQALKDEIATGKYKMVCLDYNLNKNRKLLENLPEEDRDKCEFLVNAICPPGCPSRKEHYKLNGLYHLSYGLQYRVDKCSIMHNTVHPSVMSNANNLTLEDIINDYEPLGYKYFKLEGRTLSILENACNYVRYTVKPEYQLYVINLLVESASLEPSAIKEIPNCLYI